jgi:NitT/TauT family transport system ATP-binding protein
VLSRRPSTIKEIVTIELERPRTADARKSPEFHAYADRLWTLISEESAVPAGVADGG